MYLLYAYSSAHTHGRILYVCDCAFVCVSGIFIGAEEAGPGLGVLRGRHRLPGAVEPLVCLHWWEEGWAGLLAGGYTERETGQGG